LIRQAVKHRPKQLAHNDEGRSSQLGADIAVHPLTVSSMHSISQASAGIRDQNSRRKDQGWLDSMLSVQNPYLDPVRCFLYIKPLLALKLKPYAFVSLFSDFVA
jgi:hypothetical protein